MTTPRSPRHAQFRGAAVAAALASLLLAGCGGSDDDGAVVEGPTPTAAAEAEATDGGVGEPAEAPPADEAEQPGGGGDSADVPAVAPMPEPEFAVFLRSLWEHVFQAPVGLIEAEVGERSPVLVPPGTYTTEAMYTPMTFTVDEHTRLLAERAPFLALVDHSAPGLWSPPLLEFMRPHELVDPANTDEGPPEWPDTVAGWDFDAWFAALPDIAVERTEVTVGGVEANRFDIDLPGDGSVGWEAERDLWIVPLVIRYGDGPFDLLSTQLQRVWVIPQADSAPIVAVAVVERNEGWADFGPVVDDMIASIEFGEVQPVAIPENLWEAGYPARIPAGRVRLPVLGGVSFDLPQDYFVAQAPNWSYIEMFQAEFDLFPPNVEVAGAIEAIDGTRIESAEQLAELMVDRASATRLPDAEIVGRPAVVVEMLGVQPGVPVFRHIDTPEGADPGLAGWFTQDFVELWAIDTDEGVLIVTAEADSAEALEVALVLHETVRTSLELD